MNPKKGGVELLMWYVGGGLTEWSILARILQQSLRPLQKTARSTVLYKLTDCAEMELTCQYLLLDNRDPDSCKKGNVFTVKAAGEKPKR